MPGAVSRLGRLCLLVGVTGTDACGDVPRPERMAGVESRAALDPGGGSPPRYRGPHEGEVRHLLLTAGSWRTSRDVRTDGGVPPRVPVGNCMRDGYVAAAVQYAWAAESYHRLGNSMAPRMAESMHLELGRAYRLCTSRDDDLDGCRATVLWECPPAGGQSPRDSGPDEADPAGG